jgi:ubiquitin-protein ligase
MEEDDNNTDFDRDSGGMETGGEDDNQSDYSYHEDQEDGDEDNYQYEDDERVDTYVKSYIGMQFDGNMHAMLQAPGKSALYPVYKQLSEICLVDISPDFYSALLTIGVKDQVIMLTIKFPEKAPFFPNAPPSLELQSRFLYPNERFNILFNCHPLLLGAQWNFCTDIVQIVRDLIQVAETSVVDTLDEDFDAGAGVQRKIIKMLHQNTLDITSLFPDSQKNKLPSFGILREAAATASKETRPRGTGYSSGHGDTRDTKWDVVSHTTAKLDGLLELTKKVQEDIRKAEARGAQVDPILVDAVYFIFSHTVSRTVTMEEFFRHLPFYDLVIESLLPLPPPSEHIAPVQSLLKLYQAIVSGRLSESLEPAELVVLNKLKVLNDRLQKSAQTSTGSSSDAADRKTSPRGSQAKDAGEASAGRAVSAGGSKKRHLSGTDAKPSAEESSVGDSKACASSSSSMLSVSAIPRVVELEDAFEVHKYASDMKGIAHMNAKWYRRQHMELGTMPESLPDNVIVFSGMQCSQPNLMKILMFPESPDTPYCGGCFLFDAFVPTDYPNNPPKVNLITTGEFLCAVIHAMSALLSGSCIRRFCS